MIIEREDEIALREFTKEDIPKIAEYGNNKKISTNLKDAFPSPYTIEDAEKFLEMVNKQNPRTFFAIEHNGQYVGNISLSKGSDVYRKSAEIGYFIAEPFWNKGIATKAIQLMIRFGFDTLDVIRIYAGVFEFNEASQHVLEKCGFIKEGVFKKAICKNNKMYNEIVYSKLKE